MTCQDFLSRYSEYLDDWMNEAESALWRAHLDACASCARYDRVVRHGARLVRELEIQPTPEFRSRLEHRLQHLHRGLGAAARGYGPGTAATLMIAAALALLAWAPALRLADAPDVAASAGAAANGEVAAAEPVAAQAAESGQTPSADEAIPPVPAFAGVEDGGMIRLAAEAGVGAEDADIGLAAATTEGPRLRLVPIDAAQPLVQWSQPRYSPLIVPTPAYRLVGGSAAGPAMLWRAGTASPAVRPVSLDAGTPTVIE